MDTRTRLPEGFYFWGRLAQDNLTSALPVSKLHIVFPEGGTVCDAYTVKETMLTKRTINPSAKGVHWTMAFSILQGRYVLGVSINRRTQHLVDEFCPACVSRLKEQ